MFRSSPILERQRQKHLERTASKAVSHTTAHTTVELLDASRRLQQNADMMYAAASDFDDVRRLRATVESYGMSKSLMAILPENIHNTLPGMPAFESLDRIPLPRHDPRTSRILEGLSAAMEEESSYVKIWVKDTCKNVCTHLDLLGEKANEYREQATSLRDRLHGMYVSELILKEIVVTCLSAKSQLDVIKTLCSVISDFDIPPHSVSLNDLNTNMDMLNTVFERICPMTGICFDDTGRVVINKDKIASEYTPTEENLYAKGYSVEKAVELCDAIMSLSACLSELADKKSSIVERLEAIHDEFGEDEPDNSPPANPEENSDDEPEHVPEDAPSEEPSEEPTETPDSEPAEEQADDDEKYSMDAHRQMLCCWVCFLGTLTETSINTMSSSMMVAEKIQSAT